MWGRKKATPEPAHVETAAEYWAKRDAEREARAAQAVADEVVWEGYAAPTRQPSDGEIFNYELSAYSEKTGYCADGIQRVCPLPRRK